jgi:hypothetical protein
MSNYTVCAEDFYVAIERRGATAHWATPPLPATDVVAYRGCYTFPNGLADCSHISYEEAA